MLDLLLESGARRPRRHAGWTVGSAGAHTLLIAVTAALTTAVPRHAIQPERVREMLVYRETRVDNAPRRPRGGGASVAPVGPPARLPSIALPAVGVPDFTAPDVSEPFASERVLLGLTVFGKPSGVPEGGIYSHALVERPVAAHRANGQPRYPDALRGAGVEGEVLVRFVVDTLGRVEHGSIEIMRRAHPLFEKAVAEWLARSRYTPALAAGRRVRQLVQQRINFALAR